MAMPMGPKPYQPANVRTSNRFVPACLSFLLACLSAFTFQILFFSPISPGSPLEFPLPTSSSLPTNNQLQVNNFTVYTYLLPFDLFLLNYHINLTSVNTSIWFQYQRVIKLGEGFLKDPEDVCVDKEGTIYTATRDGWIKRLHRNGSWENWKMTNSHTLLGITITKEGGLIVCDSEKVTLLSNYQGAYCIE